MCGIDNFENYVKTMYAINVGNKYINNCIDNQKV